MKNNRYKIASIIACTLFVHISNVYAYQQRTNLTSAIVAGKILDDETGEPLPLSNVYLANTTLGMAADADGQFTIHNVPIGEYDLIASYVGYNVQRVKLRIRKNDYYDYTIRLKPLTAKLDEVVVEGEIKEWKRNLKIFEGKFLGTSKNAKKTRILNPEILAFDHTKEPFDFTAKAQGLLNIENLALGYTLNIHLTEFELTSKKILIEFYSSFTPMKTNDNNQQREWEQNRKRAYNGSLNHFLKSLINNKLEEEEFAIVELDKMPYKGVETKSKPVSRNSIMYFSGYRDQFELSFNNFLQIVYRGEKEEREYINWTRASSNAQHVFVPAKNYQTSWLELRSESKLVNKNGYLYDGKGLIRHGYLSWERIADMLPRDYEYTLKSSSDRAKRE